MLKPQRYKLLVNTDWALCLFTENLLWKMKRKKQQQLGPKKKEQGMGTSLRGLRWLRVVQFLISIHLSLFSYSLQGAASPQESWSSLVQDHWKLYRGNSSFVFPLHSSSFLLPKQIYLHSEVNSPANCAFHWLSSIEALFEHSGSFEGKTEKSKPPSFIPLGILQKLHCQNECILLSLLTYWLCVRSLGGLFVNQRTSHMTFMRKTSYDFLCVYSEFSLEILWFWQHCFCDAGR